MLLGGVLASDPQSPSGAGRGLSGLREGRGQWMWRLSHWKYLLVECDTQCQKVLTVKEWAWPVGLFPAAWQMCLHVAVLALYTTEPLRGRREVGKGRGISSYSACFANNSTLATIPLVWGKELVYHFN